MASSLSTETLVVFHAEQERVPLPPGHRFPSAKYGLLRERLATELPVITVADATEVTEGELALVHTPAYIDGILHGTLDARAWREIGFPWSPQLVARSRRSVGATLAATRRVLGLAASDGAWAIAGNLGGGTHHASSDRGGGFCLFNDVAVSARVAQAEWARRHPRRHDGLRVAVIDLDVHQGNGTAAIFQRDDTVFTLSLHGGRNFPFQKVAGDLDVELPDGCDDGAYLHALDFALAELAQRFDPGLVYYLAGADVHEHDRLGRLALSFEGMAARDRRVIDWAGSRAAPLVIVMAGGYGRDLTTTVTAQVQTWHAALEGRRRWQNQRR